jgi:hypothetical protein
VLLDEEVPEKNCSCTSDDDEDGVEEHRGGVATPDFAAELHPDASLHWTTAGQEYTDAEGVKVFTMVDKVFTMVDKVRIAARNRETLLGAGR